jgi:hypothetical protein
MYYTRYSCQTSTKLDISRQIFENYLNIMKILCVGAELFHADGRKDRQTYRHEKANSLFSQFCERAYEVHVLLYTGIMRSHKFSFYVGLS